MHRSTALLTSMYRMCRVNWTRACVIFTFCVCLVIMMFTMFTGQMLPHRRWYDYPAPCNTHHSILTDMQTLVFKINDALSELEVPHIVCYGTLWGTLRDGKILPWDNNVDICVNSADMDKIDGSHLTDIFRKKELSISFDSRLGHYEVKYKSAVGYVTMFLGTFYGEMFRTGWVNNIMWWFQAKPISFPSHLLEAPFPTAKLYDRPVPVPHESIEILKYLYPDDWWLVRKPPGCQ